jgi:putative PIN family toxin of toxin-antitoxin system
MKPDTAPRQLLELCLDGKIRPLMSNALFLEYLDVQCREQLFNGCAVSPKEREIVFDAFLGSCQWINIYFRWRPNLRDEADNYLIELAVAGGANYIVTGNIKDFVRPELLFPELRIVSVREFITLYQGASKWQP